MRGKGEGAGGGKGVFGSHVKRARGAWEGLLGRGPMGMWVLCFVAWLLKRAWEVLSGESMVMWGGAQRGTTAACFPYYYSATA